MSSPIPAVAVLVSHRITSYETWKKAFDAHQPMREGASCLGHSVLRGVDDPKMVYIYSPATDVEKVKAFADSPSLQKAMKDAGVQGPPTLTLLKPMSDDTTNEPALAGMIVRHQVRDYGAWRKAYDQFDKTRKRLGILGHAVNQVLGNPKELVIYHQARDVDTLRSFFDSTELKEAMQRAGTSGTPEVHFVKEVEIAKYAGGHPPHAKAG